MRHSNAFTNGYAQFSRPLSKTSGGCHWVSYTGIGLVARQCYPLAAIARCNIAQFVAPNEFGVDALLLLHLHVGSQSVRSCIVRQDHHACRDKATIATHEIIEMLENGETLLRHTN